jgi:hypothetical protein
MNRSSPQTKQQSVVHGGYNRHGYEIWRGGRPVYWAGNHVQDSGHVAPRREERLPLITIRRFCIRTAREIASEQGGRFVGGERVTEAGQERQQHINIKRKEK